MSRLFEEPVPIQVEVDTSGMPASVVWAAAGHRVVEVCSRWRVDDDWWRVPVSRMYYTLRTPLVLLDVYHDLHTDGWFLERLHD